MSPWFRLLVGVLLLFLLAPLIVVLLTSFSNDSFLAFPPQNWGFAGYRALLANEAFRRGFGVSIVLGLAVTGISLVCGTAAAYAIARLRVPGAGTLLALFTAPLLLPGIILGLGLLLVFARLGWLATWPGLMIGHCLVTLPYVIRVVLTSLRGIDATLEEAAASLGAAPVRVFRRVTLPLMLPGITAAAALSFLASFDEVVISLFLVGPRLTTLPIEVFHTIQYRADPQISALSVVLIALTAGLVVVVERSLGFLRALGR
ncbi:ABC transporter permease [Limobrevibacterium gyesilva]|uniref:ABC transporter permease subunit n=1 Tax=Limobrevibacterium gyesilva TaxID=2991712 RepID=A0AA42CHN3_9PROT|nr:ABC transporter permease subunit [Limobrevibacterium gyesilva]MCW3475055.1 ABC transporter permease subunit [Limobrevibacterium gyesilva]